MAALKPVEKVEQLEAAVVKNDIKEVQALLAKPGKLEFTARAVGLAMRFGGVDMVRTLLEGGASLTYIMTRELDDAYHCAFAASWGRQTDYSKYMFPAIPIPAAFKGTPVSEKARLDTIKYLVKLNIPSIHTFLYYSILSGDTEVTEYLMSHHVNALPTPYAGIVQGSVPTQQIKLIRVAEYVDEFRDIMAAHTDAAMAQAIRDFVACTGPGTKIPMFRYEVLDLQRACAPDLFATICEHTDLTRKYPRLDILHYIVESKSIAALQYVLANKWLKNAGDREYLLEYARRAKDPSSEVISTILEAEQSRKTKKRKPDAGALAVDDLSLDDRLLTLPEVRKTWGCRKIGEGEFQIFSYKGTNPVAVIPSEIKGGKITSVDVTTFQTEGAGVDPRMARSRAELTSVEIPGTITKIPSQFLRGHQNLKTVVFGEGVQEIKESAFCECEALEQVTLPSSLHKIGPQAFAGCTSLREIDLPEQLEVLAAQAFVGTGIKKVTIPATLGTVGAAAFARTPVLQEVQFATDAGGQSALKDIQLQAFFASGIESLTLPAGTRTVGPSAFDTCASLAHVSVPPTTTLEEYAFWGCNKLANEDGAIVVNGSLFGVTGMVSNLELTDERLLKPLAIGDDIKQVAVALYLLPEIVYRPADSPAITKIESPTKSIVKFGRFPDKTDLQMKPIAWKVLDRRQGMMLLMTTSCIMRDSFKDGDPAESDVSPWETSNLRALLNGPFLDIAFNESERALIKSVTLVTRGKGKQESRTTDRVFVLSEGEYRNYRGYAKKVDVYPTEYAAAQTAPRTSWFGSVEQPTTETPVRWRLRSCDEWQCVYPGGEVSGRSWYMRRASEQCYVRPAIWVSTK